MPVQIPSINRFDTQAPQSEGRLQVGAPNLLGATAPLREGADNLVGAAFEKTGEYQKKQLAAKDLKATEAAVKYETYLKGYLTKIEPLKGDPTDVYKTFDKDMADAEGKAFDGITDADTQLLLQKKILNINGRVNDSRTTQYTKQFYGWQKDVSDAKVKITQDNAMKSSEFLNVKDPLTFGKVNNHLADIEQTRVAVARQNGYDISMTTDDNGRSMIDYSKAPEIEAQIKADIGDALIPMVKSLNAAGKVNEGKELIERQKRWLNAKDYSALVADNNEANVKSQALVYVSTMKNKSGKAALDEIALSDLSEDIKFKSREIVDTLDRQNENANERKRKDANKKLYDYVDQRQSSNQSFATIAQLKDDPAYKEMKQYMTPAELRAIEQRVEAPPVSDPKALSNVSDTYIKTAFKGLSNDEFNLLIKDLDQSHRDKYRSLRERQTKPPQGMTEAQMVARMNQMNKFMVSDAKLAGVVGSENKTKWSQADQTQYDKLSSQWVQYQLDHDDEYNLKDPNTQKAMVRDFIREFISLPQNVPLPQKKIFGFEYGARPFKQLDDVPMRRSINKSPLMTPDNTTTLGAKINNAAQNKATKPVNKSANIADFTQAEYTYWKNEYMKETGSSSAPEDMDVFQEWINKRVKK